MLNDTWIPVLPDATARDLLGQRAVIATLGKAIERLPAPACIAVYGPWGSGKTNILRNAMRNASADLHIPVWFDPWQYDRQPDLLGPLLRALLVEMRERTRKEPERAERFIAAAKGLGRMLLSLGVRVAIRGGANALLPLAIASDADGEMPVEVAAGDSGKLDIDGWLRGRGEPGDEVERIKAQFRELVDATLELTAADGAQSDNRRVVFFLDDLDRCLPDRVVDLIERVKLLLCGTERRMSSARDDHADADPAAGASKAVFVFALDRRIVGEAIRHRFPGASQYSGENYLEKIFDFSLETPPVPSETKAVSRFVEHWAEGLGGIDTLAAPFGGRPNLVAALALPPLANPRVIKRTLNRLTLLLDEPSRARLIVDAGWQTHDQRRHALVWLAGAERFRVIRHLIRRGETQAFQRLLDHLRDAPKKPVLLSETGRLVTLPGLLPYLDALGLVGSKRHTELEQFAGKPIQPGSLRWFDDLMRSAGL